jgi:methyl-accepting chemotaxis protein
MPVDTGGESWFANLRMGFKIFITVAVVAAVALGVTVVSLVRLNATNAALEKLSQQNVARLQYFGDIRGGLGDINNGAATLLGGALMKVPGSQELGNKIIIDAAARVDASVTKYNELARGTVAAKQSTDLNQSWQLYKYSLRIVTLNEAPTPGMPKVDKTTIGALTLQVGRQVAELAQIERKDADRVVAEGKAAYRQAVIWIVAALLLGLALAAAVATVVTRMIVSRVKATADALHQVSEGDLTAHLDVHGKDEIGEMADALNATVGTIRDVIRQIGTEADSLAAVAADASSGKDGVETTARMAEMADSLNAMISIFVTEGAESQQGSHTA